MSVRKKPTNTNKYLLLFDISTVVNTSRLIGIIEVNKLGYYDRMVYDFGNNISYTYGNTIFGNNCIVCGWKPQVREITETVLNDMVWKEDAICKLSTVFPGLYTILVGGKPIMQKPRKRTPEQEEIHREKKIKLLMGGKFIFGGGVRKNIYKRRDDNSVVAIFINKRGNTRKCVIKESLYKRIANENFVEPITYDWVLFLRKHEGRVKYLDFDAWRREYSDVKAEDVGRGGRERNKKDGKDK